MCTPKLVIIFWTLVDLKSLELDLINSSKTFKKDENFICGEYICTQLIFVT
jgi:hypothetical protein